MEMVEEDGTAMLSHPILADVTSETTIWPSHMPSALLKTIARTVLQIP